MRPAWLLFAAATFSARALSAEPARAAVETRLSGYERAFSGDDLRALGPGADHVLAEIAGDPRAPPVLRARAVSALGFARTPTSRTFLEKLLASKLKSNDPLDRLLLRKAAVALGWQGLPDAVPLLAPLLGHTDEDVRLDAALALGLTRAPAALEPLRSRLPQETAGPVRFQISKQVRALEALLEPAAPAPSRPK